MKMRDVARRLVREERRKSSVGLDTEGHAAFRVCEKLRRSLFRLVGVVGFRSLLSRALTLARARASWLGVVQINMDGSLEVPAAVEAQLDQEEAAKAGVVLIEQLLELLVTFIGETLTLRFVQEGWPKASLDDLKTERDPL
jgi:hypothetical protein